MSIIAYPYDMKGRERDISELDAALRDRNLKGYVGISTTPKGVFINIETQDRPVRPPPPPRIPPRQEVVFEKVDEDFAEWDAIYNPDGTPKIR
jgi:hypothetical protein